MEHNKCGICGANLDAGEICDCRQESSDKPFDAASYYIKPQSFTIDDALAAMRAIKSILARLKNEKEKI